MGSKHTPGPWVVDETKALGAYGVWTDYATHPGHDGAGYPSQICSVPVMSSREEKDANARLIAAAPELLSALKAVVSVADRKTAEFDLAHAAIVKAEGKR